MFYYTSKFFGEIDLLGLEPAHAHAVWGLISEFSSLQRNVLLDASKSRGNLKDLELSLYHVLHQAYPGGERRDKAMASVVGMVYHDLRFRLHEIFDATFPNGQQAKGRKREGVGDSDSSYIDDFSRFVVMLLADGKSKAETSKSISVHKSTLSRALSKKTLLQIVERSPFSLGLVSGRGPVADDTKSINLIVDRFQPLSIRELHCCAIGSEIGQLIQRNRSILFEPAFDQLKDIRRHVANAMIEITGIDVDNNDSRAAFETLCRQATYAISDPNSSRIGKSFIHNHSCFNWSVPEKKQLNFVGQSERLTDWLESFHCGKLLPRLNGETTTYYVVNKSCEDNENKWGEIQKYVESFVDSECDETSELIAKAHWKNSWIELIRRIVDNTAELDPVRHPISGRQEQEETEFYEHSSTDLILRQHAMLTRGLLELQMLAALRFYANSGTAEERNLRIAPVLKEMAIQLDQMEKNIYAREDYQIANFVFADIRFHLAPSDYLQKISKDLLPANASELEKYLSLSLLGRDELRFKTELGRQQIVDEHRMILESTEKYLSSSDSGSGIKSRSQTSVETVNPLLSANDVAMSLGKHLFQAIYDEAGSSAARMQSGKNIDQLQEVALMFELMLSQGLRFEPVKLWDKAEIDSLIYLSDSFPQKELVLWSSESSKQQKSIVQIQQLRFIFALDKAYRRHAQSRDKVDPQLRTLMAIFVSERDFIDKLLSMELVSKKGLKSRLDQAYTGMGGDYDCKKYVARFKDQVESLFEILSDDCNVDELLDGFIQNGNKMAIELKAQVKDFFRSSAGYSDKTRVKELLNCIQVFDLPKEFHKQFIIEIGGTVAWHLNGINLIYTYRQDLNEGASRVIDTRGDRNSELFDLIYSMVEKAGSDKVDDLFSVVAPDDSDSLDNVAVLHRLEELIMTWKPIGQGAPIVERRGSESPRHDIENWSKISFTILLMILPLFQDERRNQLGNFRDTLVINRALQESFVSFDPKPSAKSSG